ncbi:MAG TPA: hypothetical protein VKY65_07045 [Alphaproteobacteria bacterium]|nr:hypothetical protein [Alphaproteobacteria bacterium]
MQGFSRLIACALMAVGGAVTIAAAAYAGEPDTVKVELWNKSDGTMGITLSQDKIKAGAVEFKIKNASGNTMHEFLITPWKQDVKSLPYDAKEDEVAEDKLPRLAGIEDMKPGTAATLRLALPPGTYVVFCNQTGHYKMGMARRLTVTR